jgi:hypothetical protein
MIAVNPASVGLEYPVGEAKALALPFVTSFCLILHLTSHCKVFLTRWAPYWESRPNQHLFDPHNWRPLHNTQMYAILPSYDFTWSFKHVARCVKLRQPLRTRNHLCKISDWAEWNLLKTLVKEPISGTVVRALMTDYSKADLRMELDCSLCRE